MELMYEGKAKKVFRLDSDRLLHEFKNDATAFNGKKRGTIENKGRINATMSSLLFKYLEKFGIATHFIEQSEENKIITKNLDMIPLEFIGRNIVAGSLSDRLGLPEGIILRSPIVESYYKNDTLGDPLFTDDHIFAVNMTTREELIELKAATIRANRILKDLFLKCNLKLVDFKLEFGREDSLIYVADEISPDTCRLWDVDSDAKLDKDRFRRDLGGVEEAYEIVLGRLRAELGYHDS